MKKAFILALGLSAVGFSASAQGVSFGPRIGVNLAKASLTNTDDNIEKAFNDAAKSRIGMQLGVALNLGITGSFSVQPELLFSQQGYRSEETESTVIGVDTRTIESKSTFKANYIQVPLLARYAIGSDNFRVFVNAGPYFSYWVNGSTKTEETTTYRGTKETKKTETDIEFDKAKDIIDYSRADVGLVAGAGLGFGALELDVRYNLGLGSMIKTEGEDKSKQVNRFIGVGVSYMFGK